MQGDGRRTGCTDRQRSRARALPPGAPRRPREGEGGRAGGGMHGQATGGGTGASPGITPKVARWAGRVVSALVVAFLLFDASIKVMMLEPAVEGSVQLGYPEGTVLGIGLALLVGTLLYAVPRTAPPGALLPPPLPRRAPARVRGGRAVGEGGARARRRAPLRGAAYGVPRGDPAHGLPGRGRGDPGARRGPMVPVPRHLRSAGVGRALPARRADQGPRPGVSPGRDRSSRSSAGRVAPLGPSRSGSRSPPADSKDSRSAQNEN